MGERKEQKGRKEEMTIKEGNWRTPRQKCNYHEISGGVQCIISGLSVMNNTVIDKDHRWPQSLGGIKHISNQLDLCSHHNKAKNFGLWGYNWDPQEFPSWLNDVLKQMWKDVKLNGRDV